MLVFFTNLGLMEFRVRYLALFRLFSLIDGFDWLWMESFLENIQLMQKFLKTFFLQHINDPPYVVICSTDICDDDTTFYSKCDQTSNMCQLKIAPEVESDIWDTEGWGRKWLVDSNSEKIQLVFYDRSIKTGAIDVKMDGSILQKKDLWRCWGWLSLLNWLGALT